MVGKDQKKQYITMGHMCGKWFMHFMRGARLQMGMVRRQNEALTSKLALGICARAKRIWGLLQQDTKQMEIEDSFCFMLIMFGAGLWGKEVQLVLVCSLKGLLKFWRETKEGDKDKRYMMITLSGCFKGEVDSQWHMVPISNRTHSNIPFYLCMERIMVRRVSYQHRTKGWLFKTRIGARAKFGRYNTTFRSLFSLAWATNSWLVPNVIKLKDFRFWRLPRRSAVLKTTQQGVYSKVMELINRWGSMS